MGRATKAAWLEPTHRGRGEGQTYQNKDGPEANHPTVISIDPVGRGCKSARCRRMRRHETRIQKLAARPTNLSESLMSTKRLPRPPTLSTHRCLPLAVLVAFRTAGTRSSIPLYRSAVCESGKDR